MLIMRWAAKYDTIRESLYNVLQDSRILTYTLKDEIRYPSAVTPAFNQYTATTKNNFVETKSPNPNGSSPYPIRYENGQNTLGMALGWTYDLKWEKIRLFFNKMIEDNLEFLLVDEEFGKFFSASLFYDDGAVASDADKRLAALYYMMLLVNNSSKVELIESHAPVVANSYLATSIPSTGYFVRNNDEDWTSQAFAGGQMYPIPWITSTNLSLKDFWDMSLSTNAADKSKYRNFTIGNGPFDLSYLVK